MFQANLKRAHHGWSSLANRVFGPEPVQVQLDFPPIMPFSYRPGTTDLLVLEQVFLDREYDVEPIAPESIEYIVDLGSNIGVTAIFWAQRYPKARMALVEPDPDNFALLQRNTAAFQDRCVLFNAAVSDRRGKTSFFRSDREYGHSMLKTDDCVSEMQVKTLTVSDVLQRGGISARGFIEDGHRRRRANRDADDWRWKHAPRYLIAELHPPYNLDTLRPLPIRRVAATRSRARVSVAICLSPRKRPHLVELRLRSDTYAPAGQVCATGFEPAGCR